MSRTVRLINAKGEMIDLTTADYFANELEDLGISFANEYIGSFGSFREVSSEIELASFQSSIYISIHGFKEADLYSNLVQFLASPPFNLEFSFFDSTLLRKCRLKSISKSAIDHETSLLTETIALDFISPWYKIKHAQIRQNSTNVATRGKVYGFARPYVYTQNSREKTSGYKIKNDSIYLTANKERMSPLKITVSGFCINPYWEVFQGSTLVSSDSYSLTLQDGQKLTVSSLFQERTAILTDQNGVESSVYQQQDITKSGFVHAPIGESTIVFHVGDASVDVEIYEEADLF